MMWLAANYLSGADLSAAQHYLTHLFREKLIESKSRVIVVSSGAIRRVSDTGKILHYL